MFPPTSPYSERIRIQNETRDLTEQAAQRFDTGMSRRWNLFGWLRPSKQSPVQLACPPSRRAANPVSVGILAFLLASLGWRTTPHI